MRGCTFVVAINSANRAVSRPVFTRLVLALTVVEKLRFVHNLVQVAMSASSAPEAKAA